MVRGTEREPILRTTSKLLGLFALVAGAVGCGSSAPGGTGTMNVHLVDGPADYAAVNLDIREVNIRVDGGWITLGTPNRVVNLLDLTGGVAETLVDGAALPAGSYGQMRLVLGPDNSVVLNDGTEFALKVPSGQQSGVKFPVHVDVAPNTTADVFIDFDAHRSIFVHAAGKSGKYMMRPVVRAVDRVVTGAATGKLTDKLSGAPLGGVTVTAQVIDEDGVPRIVRTTKTGADGSYSLDLLDVGTTYYVVAQPVTATASYVAQSSGPITVTSTAPIRQWSAAFTLASGAGAIAGSLSPVAAVSDSDEVAVQQVLSDSNGSARPLIVRSAAGEVASPLSETYDIAGLPAGDYTVSVTRSIDADDDGEPETVKRVNPAPAIVAGGNTTVVDVSIP